MQEVSCDGDVSRWVLRQELPRKRKSWLSRSTADTGCILNTRKTLSYHLSLEEIVCLKRDGFLSIWNLELPLCHWTWHMIASMPSNSLLMVADLGLQIISVISFQTIWLRPCLPALDRYRIISAVTWHHYRDIYTQTPHYHQMHHIHVMFQTTITTHTCSVHVSETEVLLKQFNVSLPCQGHSSKHLVHGSRDKTKHTTRSTPLAMQPQGRSITWVFT